MAVIQINGKEGTFMRTEQKLEVLIIDDSKAILDRLKSEIQKLSNVREINTGCNYREGRELIENKDYDFVIFDIKLPDKSGIELLRFLGTKSNRKTTKIMITDEPSPELESICTSLGAHYFLSKFDDFEKIPRIIEA